MSMFRTKLKERGNGTKITIVGQFANNISGSALRSVLTNVKDFYTGEYLCDHICIRYVYLQYLEFFKGCFIICHGTIQDYTGGNGCYNYGVTDIDYSYCVKSYMYLNELVFTSFLYHKDGWYWSNYNGLPDYVFNFKELSEGDDYSYLRHLCVTEDNSYYVVKNYSHEHRYLEYKEKETVLLIYMTKEIAFRKVREDLEFRLYLDSLSES